MQLDSVHLIYFSPTHTSRSIGKAIARGTGLSRITETDLTYEMPAKPVNTGKALTVIAVPVYGGRVAETAIQRLGRVVGEGNPVILAAVYGNRDYEDALLELRDFAVNQGFVPVAGGAFIGEHSYSRADRPVAAGRPDTDDLKKAEKFGTAAVEKLGSMNGCADISVLAVNGNHPYKVKGAKTPQAPVVVEELCTECGHCAEICPAGAITVEVVTDAEACIKCCACVKECPQKARIFDTPFTDYLFTNFSSRREPEVFY